MVKFQPREGHMGMHYFACPEGYKLIGDFHQEFAVTIPKWYKEHPDIPQPEPMRNLLIVPSQMRKYYDKMEGIRELKNRGFLKHVMVDSGGYQAMTGKDKLQRLINTNYCIYNRYHDVADVMVALDYPPTGNDDPMVYSAKVDQTIETTMFLWDRLRPKAREKYAPVYHPRGISDIDLFTKCYEPILEQSQFATYSAAPLTRGVRRITKYIGRVMEEFVKRMDSLGVKTHCLGISSPTAVRQLASMGFTTFDSVSTIKAAVFGNILFPFMNGSVQCSDRLDTSISESELRSLQEQYGHICPYCDDYEKLKAGRQVRMKHNMIVMDELTWRYKGLKPLPKEGQMDLF